MRDTFFGEEPLNRVSSVFDSISLTSLTKTSLESTSNMPSDGAMAGGLSVGSWRRPDLVVSAKLVRPKSGLGERRDGFEETSAFGSAQLLAYLISQSNIQHGQSGQQTSPNYPRRVGGVGGSSSCLTSVVWTGKGGGNGVINLIIGNQHCQIAGAQLQA